MKIFLAIIKNIKQRLVLFLLLFLLGLKFLTSNSFAQTSQSITISPPTITLNINPGDKKEGSLALINDSDQALSFKTNVYDFIVQDKFGTPEILPKGTIANNKYSAANWIAVYPNSITVAPHKRFELNYYIQIPVNASPGGHYSAIVYEPVTSGANQASGASIKTQIATLVYITVSGQMTEKAEVTKFQAPQFSEYGPVEIKTQIENSGDTHITPQGNITIKDIFGRTIYVSALQTRNIFPGNIALNYSNLIGQHLMFGRFQANLLASFGQQNNLPLYASLVFWVIPWRIITVSILIAIALILSIILILKRKQGKNV